MNHIATINAEGPGLKKRLKKIGSTLKGKKIKANCVNFYPSVFLNKQKPKSHIFTYKKVTSKQFVTNKVLSIP
jgi:hypothetical protein